VAPDNLAVVVTGPTSHVSGLPALLPRSCDVLVVGCGPSGAAAAYWLAESGHDVIVLEKKHFPREKTCGDGLTPRAVRQLEEMGLADELSTHHRFEGLRALAFGRELHLAWPDHPDFGRLGYVVTRAELDALVARRAEKAGARLLEGCEAVAPLSGGDRTSAGGAVVQTKDGQVGEIAARVVVVADGANSRFGRALGTSRDKSVPQGMAIRGYFSSPRHDENWIESHLDLRDPSGAAIPGYGWIFPLGDGRVNVGIGILSSAKRWKELNTTRLMETFVAAAPRSWRLGPETAVGAPTGGRLPMGLSVTPRVGRDYVIAGDAGGAINPFNGEGISYGYETGRLAAEVVDEALANDLSTLGRFETQLQETYGLYFRTASLAMNALGRPALMRALIATGMRSRSLMEWVLRIMSNQLREDERGPAELAYRAIARLARAS
jgi:menaquinone-9 beta-reductase